MEEEGFTQMHVVERGGISQGQMSRYVNGENRPELEVFERICGLFSEKRRTALILAYLLDDVPPRFRSLVTISPSANGVTSRGVEDPTQVYRSRMPKELRAAYDYLGAAALEKKNVAQMLINTYQALKTAAA